MKPITTIILLLLCSKIYTQSITGIFPEAKNKKIVLKGYDGFKDKVLSQTTTDAQGKFVLHYPKEFVGAAMLSIQNSSSLIVLLNQENFSIQWNNLQDMGSLKITHSPENEGFANGILAYQTAEQKLSGLNYLLPLYANDSSMKRTLSAEIVKQNFAFYNYISSLPQNAYVAYYLKMREFLSLLSKQEINASTKDQLIKTYSEMDFKNEKLWSSGLLKDVLEGYYKLMASEGNDSVVIDQFNKATDVWLKSLESQTGKQQEVAEFVFKMLEQHHLSPAAEHVALAMLNQSNCQLDAKRSNLFEQYRKLAIGQVAPNIQLSAQSDLKSLSNQFKLVVFGASWCNNCQSDYPSLQGVCRRLKSQIDIEVVYISIDSDTSAFKQFYSEAPFLTFCDGNGWETPSAQDYHVFATPTYLLLDKDLKILFKPESPRQLEEWFFYNH
jgi:thiol-disulfide isomerase/thioredoxin